VRKVDVSAIVGNETYAQLLDTIKLDEEDYVKETYPPHLGQRPDLALRILVRREEKDLEKQLINQL